MSTTPASLEATPPHDASHVHGNARTLAIAALGVVFGDIGTSPLYALKECVNGEHGVAPTHENVLGLLSLIFYSLVMVVTVKYLTFVMRADNEGEGGILALLALVPERLRGNGKSGIGWIAGLVLFGAALLYGDGVITPAISVLSAIEGLEVATTSLKPVVLPLTCLILVGLFAIQSRGTEGIGKIFGPIMVAWFAVLGVLGGIYIAKDPAVLVALSPVHAVRFFAEHGMHGFAVLGAVVLAITGGEALYADMGHFGRAPIRLAWYGVVLPALLLNYFGQGALLLQNPGASASPFFAMVPQGPLTYGLVGLSTAATVIASQALISGAFSLTRQGVQLGFLPRVSVKHTSSTTEGQIYVPEVNWGLAAACIALVLMFRESSRLAAAYGIAVTGTMAITSIVYYVVVRRTWGWSLAKALPLLALFLTFDLAFFGANLLKFLDGGYVPVLLALVVFVVMIVWRTGRSLLAESLAKGAVPLREFLASLPARKVARVPGTAVFLTSSAEDAPALLVHHVHRGHSLHEEVVLLTVKNEKVPRVPANRRVEVRRYEEGFSRMIVRSGFMQETNVPALLGGASKAGLPPIEPADTTYYLGRETFLATAKGRMGHVSEALFAFLARNATSASTYFGLPPEQVVELGIQIDL